MWQADTFDPERIDLELGWAAELGFNSVPAFLHDIFRTAGTRSRPEEVAYTRSITGKGSR